MKRLFPTPASRSHRLPRVLSGDAQAAVDENGILSLVLRCVFITSAAGLHRVMHVNYLTWCPANGSRPSPWPLAHRWLRQDLRHQYTPADGTNVPRLVLSGFADLMTGAVCRWGPLPT